MLALIKKDLLVYGPLLYAFLMLFLIGMTLINLPAIFIMVIGFTAVALSPFTYDEKNKVNRLLVSMPVTKQMMVTSRYLFSLLILLVVIMIQWLALNLAKITIFAPTMYNLHDFLLFFCIGMMLIAIFYPTLYLFKHSYFGMAVIFVLMFIGTFFTIDLLVHILGITGGFSLNGLDKGFALLVETYIPFQPYLVTLLIACLMFLGSIKLSGAILSKKDL